MISYRGVEVAWWRKVLRGGTLREIQHYWESGNTIHYRLNIVSLAAAAANIILIHATILQYATRTVISMEYSTVPVQALIATELPYGFTAFGFIGDGFTEAPLLVFNDSFVGIIEVSTDNLSHVALSGIYLLSSCQTVRFKIAFLMVTSLKSRII